MGTAAERSVAAIASTQYALVTSQQAYAVGLTEAQVGGRRRSGQWEDVLHGVHRIGGAPSSHRQRVLAHVLAGGPGTVASHGSAAELWGLSGFGPGSIEVSKPRGRSQRVADGRIHGSLWLPPHHITVRYGIPVTTAPRTVFDLAGWIHPKRTERTFENALAMGLVSAEQEAALVSELGKRGRRGTAVMRKLCEARGVGYVATASELEALLVEVLAGAGLPLPARQVDLGDENGWVGRVDFIYREARLIIEADGRRWHDTSLDRDEDRCRDNRFAAAGCRVIRVTWEQLMNRPWEVVRLVRDALRRPPTELVAETAVADPFLQQVR